jgi:hypothetical protein
VAALLALTAYAILLAAGCSIGPISNNLPVVASGVAFAFLSFLILRYRPENRIGWLAAVIGLSLAPLAAGSHYAQCSLAGVAVLPAQAEMAWLGTGLGVIGVSALFAGLPLLFPDGQFLSAGWRRFALAGFGLMVLVAFLVTTLPVSINIDSTTQPFNYENPFALPLLPASAARGLAAAMFLVMVPLMLGAILSLVQRWRRSTGDTRQQLKWLAYFLATAVTVQLVVFELPKAFGDPGLLADGWSELYVLAYSAIIYVVFLGFPLTIGIAIFRYRLYDIDLIIRRTLIYTAVTLTLAVVYFSSVVLLQRLLAGLTGQQSPVAIVISTLLIAGLFGSVRRRAQAIIDRRFFRQKYDAERVLAGFAQHARDEVEMAALTTALVRAVEETMRPERVSLWLKPAASTRPKQRKE